MRVKGQLDTPPPHSDSKRMPLDEWAGQVSSALSGAVASTRQKEVPGLLEEEGPGCKGSLAAAHVDCRRWERGGAASEDAEHVGGGVRTESKLDEGEFIVMVTGFNTLVKSLVTVLIC
ncbi:hypothetical protein H8959_010163 [Pygathrix nigripes]